MSRILLVSEDELTDLAHNSKLDILTRLDAVREANPEADFEEIVAFVREEALAANSGFDPYASAPEAIEEPAAVDEDPEGVSLLDADAHGQLEIIDEVPEAEVEPEPEPEVDNTPVAYSEFDATQHTEPDHIEQPEPAPARRYDTPVFPQEFVDDEASKRRAINRRVLAREVAQIDRDDD